MENPEKRNRNLYCQYHQDHGHTIEDCKSLWDHLDQLAREGKLKQLLHHSSGLGGQTTSRSEREIPSRPPWELSMLFLQRLVERDHVRLE